MLRDRTEPADPAVLLLGALAWVCADDDRASRLLALTGLDGETLRARAGESAVPGAVGGYLLDHEPDLIACAAALGCDAAMLAAAARQMAGVEQP